MRLSARVRPGAPSWIRMDAPVLAPGLAAVALFVFWAVQNGGYDTGTWSWGALVVLALTATAVLGLGRARIGLSRRTGAALICFGLYVAWSYGSILWAQDPGAALLGANRALLYLLIFGLFVVLPWTTRGVTAAVTAFAGAIGVIAIVLLVRLASGGNVQGLFVGGRLAAPTGYINSTAALFMIGALPSIALAARRELPGPLRGALVAFATADLDLALIVQSRGWLFTLPLVALVAIAVVADRLRVTAAAGLAAVAAAVPARRLLHVYQNTPSDPLSRLAVHAGRPALMLCAAVFVAATLLAWVDGLRGDRPLPAAARRGLGTALAVLGVVAVLGAGLVVSKGHPGRFISRQWHGFAHQQTASTSSHFTDVGSGRYDFWRVSLDAFAAHPILGLGQDNFADYYVRHRRTDEEPSWTHSLEMRLLAHTGIVGFALFAGFLIAALGAALAARRRGPSLRRAIAGVALLPLVVWLIHGSLDWFWEMPALSGPALGFLAAAAALARTPEDELVPEAAEREHEPAEPPPPVAGARPRPAGARRRP
ncbi:MAG: O-antigen ligase family protein, partial [Solirubrobacterales bacterium]|nr:O-antigen ligase family protein [Solirubrobacterales bacterium]